MASNCDNVLDNTCKSCIQRRCRWYLANDGSYTCGFSSPSDSYTYFNDLTDCPDKIIYKVVLPQLDRIRTDTSTANPNWGLIIAICIAVVVVLVIASFYIGTRYGKRDKLLQNNPESVPMSPA